MNKSIILIAQQFNQNNIHWAVGGSLMLQHYHLSSDPKDIDLVVSTKDIKQVDAILTSLGTKKKQTNKKEFATEYFYEYEIANVGVDVMAGFAIIHSEGTYTYPFDQHSISSTSIIAETSIPYCALEDWFVLYQLMTNRQDKVYLILSYLIQHKVTHPLLLKRALDQDLPLSVKENIQRLL